ncbi:MAG: cell division protein FtsZ [Candidatus Ryanbacteria bacterium CG10_big_fil_rev_8_21_14_0_10_43_42]|uniref:Cell division protein FtsZ n=1 Tax=Candidatus Ryanbacteria bacterium CG10_big_fil_rev_8_21_14_0_10_43_42 TaxID=1974864 RepID=A0A2M8KX70_9BACT|nr:MAG: cell division protein FtsZ [Candidatus Ryanbacteria bacterium CG10_big_fil_rev_8_21_14_0_10_43_42]
MPSIKPDVEAFARIKLVGVGGAGGNAVNHMIRLKVQGTDFIAINTDAQDLHHNLAPKKIHIGKNLTKGLGAGMNPELGRQAAEETIEEIKDALKGADMVVVVAGLGGGTGTGAAPVVAEAARQQGALTISVATKPFSFEGAQRMRIADGGMEKLKDAVDAMVMIPNDRLLAVIEKGTSFKEAFIVCDEVVRQAVQGISDLITMPGIVNVDFADVKAVMQDAGSALMGIGKGTGETRSTDAAKQAINSPLLDIAIDGARGVLFAIHGGADMSMWEIQEAARVITESIDKDAKVIFGAVEDTRLKKGEMRVTVIASGFPADARIGMGQPSGVPIASVADTSSTERKRSPSGETVISVTKSNPARTQPAKNENEEDEEKEDNEWDVPAFFRRRR